MISNLTFLVIFQCCLSVKLSHSPFQSSTTSWTSGEYSMDFEIKKLCAHCSMLIPPSKSPPGFNQRHCSNLALLETSSHDCGLCSVFLDQWSLTAVQERLPDANEDNYDQIHLEVRILETQASGETLVRGFLSVGFFVQDHALIYENEITLTTFASNCK